MQVMNSEDEYRTHNLPNKLHARVKAVVTKVSDPFQGVTFAVIPGPNRSNIYIAMELLKPLGYTELKPGDIITNG